METSNIARRSVSRTATNLATKEQYTRLATNATGTDKMIPKISISVDSNRDSNVGMVPSSLRGDHHYPSPCEERPNDDNGTFMRA